FPPLAEALRAREGTLEPGRFRLISFHENDIVYPQQLRHWLDFYGGWSIERRQALDLLHHAQFHIEAVRGYLPGFRATFIAMLERGIDPEGAARYNTAYFIGRWYRFKDPRFAKTLVATLPDYGLALFQNPVPAKPRVYLSQRPERAGSPVDPVALLGRPDFLSGKVDMIVTPDPASEDRGLGFTGGCPTLLLAHCACPMEDEPDGTLPVREKSPRCLAQRPNLPLQRLPIKSLLCCAKLWD